MTDSEFFKIMSDQDLAILGDGEIGYVKEISSRTAARIIRDAGGDEGSFPIAQKLFALHAADGTPIAIADTRESALASAFENDLTTVPLN
ncbi:MAG: DUF1150 family protein [Hyphomicrobiales bacterium]